MYTGNDHSKMINSAICCQKNKCGHANIARSNLIKIQPVMLNSLNLLISEGILFVRIHVMIIIIYRNDVRRFFDGVK